MTVAERSSRVMHVITGLDTGGAEIQLMHLVCARRLAGADDRVVSMTPGGTLRQRFEQAGVPVDDLGMKRGRPSIRALLRLVSMMRRFKPQLVQSWMYHADLLALLALRISGRWEETPLIWGIRCSDMDLKDYGRTLRWTVRLCARFSHLPDLIIANSEAGLKAHHKLGYRPFRDRVIDNGIDIARYHPNLEMRAEVRAELGIDPNVPLVAQVARVDPMKDHETLMRAMKKIPDVALLLIGLGTEKFTSANGCFGLGRRSDVARLLTACDLIVSSSAYGEGFSNALAEGMAAGLPAVATDVGDAARIISDSGRIVPPRDADALAKAIHELAFEPLTFRETRKFHARTLIEKHYSVAENVKNFEQAYASLV